MSETHRKLIETSARDGLTCVFNRAYFDDRFTCDLSFACASSEPFCVVLIDVDHFKQYNDTFGHLAGDDCLRQVAHALSATLRRQSDFVARYGGEDFEYRAKARGRNRVVDAAEIADHETMSTTGTASHRLGH